MALGPLVAEDIVGQVTAVHDMARAACHLLDPMIWHLPQLWQQWGRQFQREYPNQSIRESSLDECDRSGLAFRRTSCRVNSAYIFMMEK
jgi:hypothetical protein